MLYILFGADDFSLKERVAELKQGWGDEELLAINTTIFDARHLSLNQLINVCSSVPFLGKFRLVIVEGLLSRLEPKGKEHRPLEEWQDLIDYIPRMPSTTHLILIDGRVGRNNPLLKGLSSQAIVQEFPPLRGVRLQQWIYSRVAKEGGSISPRAVRLLAELAGDDLWILTNEIEKLCLYALGRRIEEEDVKQLTAFSREVNVFALVDAIVERRPLTALPLLHQLLAVGMAPPYLLFMLGRQIRLMVQAKELYSQRLSTAEIKERLGLSPSYPVERLLKQTASYPIERLIEVYHQLLEIDIAIKTGKWKEELALDLLVAELCQ